MSSDQLGYADVNHLVLKTLAPPGRAYWAGVAVLAAIVAGGIAT